MRQIERGVMLIRGLLLMGSVMVVAMLTIPSSWAPGGGGCGNCTTLRVRMCNTSTACAPFPACLGACECEEWNWRNCGGNGNDCQGTHVGNVPVVVTPGNCDSGAMMCICRTAGGGARVLRPKDVCTPCP
jgi:hypothetical protein